MAMAHSSLACCFSTAQVWTKIFVGSKKADSYVGS